MSTVNYHTSRSSNLAALNAIVLNVSTLTGSTIQTTATATTSSIVFSSMSGSTLTASTMTGNQITISTLTVSSINNGTPGVAAYSTFNASSINATSTMTTSTLTTTGFVGIGTNPTQALHVQGSTIVSGAIGIGTVSPTAPLHLVGSGQRILLTGAAAQTYMMFTNATNNVGYIGTGASGNDMIINAYSGYNMILQAGGAEYMRITSTGNVGIGTATSTAKFDVYGTLGGEIAHLLSGSGGANMWFGTLGSTRNAGTILWRQIGSGSTANYLGIGAHGVDDILNVAASGQVGIGITNPSSLLHVAGNIYSSTGISAPSIGASYYGGGDQRGVTNYFKPNSQPGGTFTVGFYGGAASGWADGIQLNTYYDGTGGSQNLVLFQKSGIAMRIYQGGWQSSSSYSTYADVSFQAGSDIRLKENIQDVSDARGMIDMLHPKTFYFIKDEKKIRQIGFIAQEVRDYYPQFVTGTESETQYLSMEYGKMSPIAIAACKDLYVENDALRARIDILESRLAALERSLTK